MSILDELKAQAAKQAADLDGFANRQQMKQSEFVNEILPKLQFVYTYFKEILDYLAVIESPIEVTSYCPNLPAMGTLLQSSYHLSTDGHGGLADFSKINEVSLQYQLQGTGKVKGKNYSELVYLKDNSAEVEKERRFLKKNNIPFSFSRSLKTNQEDAGIFRIKRTIPVKFHFTVDTDSSIIQLKIINHENFETSIRSLEPSQITREFLDKIAGFLLRKETDLAGKKIDDASRDAIRQKLQAEKLEKERQLQLAEEKKRLEQEELEKQKMGYKLKTFFKSKFSKDKYP